ncbi:hypothetical protein [uncultured Fibrobacter sp.]|uniref:hypothetical protein n=1 Tax=uncultured Fibrobacter sp. TaxID=261512 RepID=UPI0026129171|nr:hypothetical protein [uncultured Fibrobacter sp.]
MQLDVNKIPSYYSRLVMAKNQGHFSIARALLDIIESSPAPDATTAEGRKALEKMTQAKGHSQMVAAGIDTAAVPPAGEVADWLNYVAENTPATKALALALADYFRQANSMQVCYDLYCRAIELEGDATPEQQVALKAVADGSMANRFGCSCEAEGDYAHAAEWYKKAKAANFLGAGESLDRMNALYGMSRFFTPWLKVATMTGRKELAEAVQNLIKSDPKLAAKAETVSITESAVPPCYEEIDYWERELDKYARSGDGEGVAFFETYVAVGRILERAKMYNLALRWYKKAVANHPTANQDAHRMLPLKSKSEPLRDAEDIYDSESAIPALWKN